MDTKTIRTVLSEYPKNYRTGKVYPLFHLPGLSDAEYWMVEATAGNFFLRGQSQETLSLNRLQYIQAVLWHAVYEGFDLVPLPLETRKHKGIVECNGRLWELLPWLEGQKIDSFEKVDSTQIVSAMLTLAQFHEVTSTFPLPNEPLGISPAVQRHFGRWKSWVSGDIHELINRIRVRQRETSDFQEGELLRESLVLLDHFQMFGGDAMMMFTRGGRLSVPIQPVIGNVNRRHLLFDEDGLSGIIDFKELGADSVSLDIASLLGSLAGNDPKLWSYGLKAYRSIRPLRDEELYLMIAFDFAEMVLAGLEWLDLLFLKQREFRPEQKQAILERLRWQTARLNRYRFGHTNFVA
ncbi:MAG: phosphotransferase [Planctomycetaceae bacterium]|nr:phosphotransferase [Planctomycetaceae bacterium]